MPPKDKDATFAVDENEVEKEPTLYEWVVEKLEETFVNNIPLDSIRELPSFYMYALGVVSYMLMGFCLVYFSYKGYKQSTTQKFLSLQDDSGSCEPVLKVVDGTYYGDSQGYWSTDVKHKSSSALYQINLRNFMADNAGFKSGMDAIRLELDEIAEKMANQNLAVNLLYWMMWEYEYGVSTFHMTGDVSTIFDKKYLIGIVGNENGTCTAEQSIDFNKATSSIHVNIDISSVNDFNADQKALCDEIITPDNFGYDPAYDGTDFSMKIDMTAFTIAVAVNNEVLSFDQLELVDGSLSKGFLGTTPVNFSQQFYPRYAGHDPVYCMSYEDKHRCVIQIGDVFTAPVMTHWGSASEVMSPCSCENEDDYCDTFDILAGLIYFEYGDDAALGMAAMAELMSRYSDPFSLDNAAYDALYLNTMVPGGVNDISQRNPAHEFCYSPIVGKTCSIFTFNMYESFVYEVSQSYYQLFNGACSDSVNIADKQWSMLRKFPPTQLEEPYFECVNTWDQAIFDSVGIAAGNATTFVPLALLLTLPMVYLFLQRNSLLPPKPEYSSEELDSASRALSLVLLRIRDGKLRDVPRDSSLRVLVKDLTKTAKSEGGYPDSDDDSDDEDDSDKQQTIRSTPAGVSSSQKHVQAFRRRSSLHHKTDIFLRQAGATSGIDESNSPETKRDNTTKIPNETVSPLSLSGLFGIFSDTPSSSSTVHSQPFTTEQELEMLSISNGVRNGISSGEFYLLNEPSPKWAAGDLAPITSVSDAMKLVLHLKSEVAKVERVKGLDGLHVHKLRLKDAAADLREIDIDMIATSASAGGDAQLESLQHLFLALCDLLVFHGSLDLDCEARAVHLQHVGYVVGNRILSGQALDSLGSGRILWSSDIGPEKSRLGTSQTATSDQFYM